MIKRSGSNNELDDCRVFDIKPLLPPVKLVEEIPISPGAIENIKFARKTCEDIIKGQSDRLLVIVGPCSIHDTEAALEYAKRLRDVMPDFEKNLFLVMRVYFEKPRTTVGWKGLINDPNLDGSFQINKGLRTARKLLNEINSLGVPSGCEFLDSISPQYYCDLVSWGAIGARTTESQIHRELASGLSVPIGFKNGTDGNIKIASDAIKAASCSHHFLGVTKEGLSAIVHTTGNPSCHVILRGSNSGPNYDADSVDQTIRGLEKESLNTHIMIDCSHGNSQKKFKNQMNVANSLAEQIRNGNSNISGVMVESNLVEGRQEIPKNVDLPLESMQFGQSVTDACIGWEDTLEVLKIFYDAVEDRRSLLSSSRS